MIAVDTNILVYAHRADTTQFRRASSLVRELAEGDESWAIPWPVAHEFLSVVTNPRIYPAPTPLDGALTQLRYWSTSPSVRFVGEAPGHRVLLEEMVTAVGATGKRIHDAKIAAICVAHGVSEIWTADKDFAGYPRLRAHNPLLERGGNDV